MFITLNLPTHKVICCTFEERKLRAQEFLEVSSPPSFILHCFKDGKSLDAVLQRELDGMIRENFDGNSRKYEMHNHSTTSPFPLEASIFTSLCTDNLVSGYSLSFICTLHA